ncbi:MAG: hypothetical protein RI885_449 [Actinomycetota bacterium]|jgi:hypothetical protein
MPFCFMPLCAEVVRLKWPRSQPLKGLLDGERLNT